MYNIKCSKIISIILFACLLITSIPAGQTVLVKAAAKASVKEDDSISEASLTEEFTGNGTKEYPFLIDSAKSLRTMAELINNQETYGSDLEYSGAYYKVISDIDLNDYDNTEDNWTTIAKDHTKVHFNGSFDGGGHRISNLRMSGDDNCMGLFGTLGESAVVKDVILINVDISSSNISGGTIGGIANDNHAGTISGCYVSGQISGEINGVDIGGIVSYNGSGGQIDRCGTSLCIDKYANSGGIASTNSGSITNCFSSGIINNYFNKEGGTAGGINGIQGDDSVTSDCYSTMDIYGSKCTGGITGELQNNSTLSNCAYFGSYLSGIFCARIAIVNSEDKQLNNCYSWDGVLISNDKNGFTSTKVQCSDTSDEQGADIKFDSDNRIFSVDFQNIFVGEASKWRFNTDNGSFPILEDYSQECETNPLCHIGTRGKSENKPFMINTPKQLEDLAKVIEDSSYVSPYRYTNTEDSYYCLGNDIDLGGYDNDNDSSNGNWKPMGDDITPFWGHFNGNNHAICNMKMYGKKVESGGLFSALDKGIVRNLGMKNVDIKLESTRAGAIAGLMTGSSKIENCSVTGSITNGSVAGGIAGVCYGGAFANCYVIGDIDGNEAGGICELLCDNCKVDNCYYRGKLEANTYAGGIVARCYSSTLSYCYSVADINVSKLGDNAEGGGIVGFAQNGSKVMQCASFGEKITDSQGGSMQAGRIIGSVNDTEIDGCYAYKDMQIIIDTQSQTVTGNASDANGADVAYSGGKLSTGFGEIFKNNTNSAWDEMTDDVLPCLNYGSKPDTYTDIQDSTIPYYITNDTSLGTEEKPFVIENEIQLVDLCKLANDNSYVSRYGFTNTEDSYYSIKRNLDMGGYKNCIPAGTNEATKDSFKGHIDGNMRVIKDVTIESDEKVSIGLFSETYVGSEITRIRLENVRINANGGGNVGGIAGYALGDITNCSVTGEIEVSGGACVAGGIAGITYGNVKNCYSVTDVESVGNAGGITGFADRGTISVCYSTGDIKAGGYAGGIVGNNGSSKVEYCVVLSGAVSGGDSTGRIVGVIQGSTDDKLVSDCYAWNRMIVKNGSKEAQVLESDDEDSLNGADLYFYKGFTDDACHKYVFDWKGHGFSDENGWLLPSFGDTDYAPQNLPGFVNTSDISPVISMKYAKMYTESLSQDYYLCEIKTDLEYDGNDKNCSISRKDGTTEGLVVKYQTSESTDLLDSVLNVGRYCPVFSSCMYKQNCPLNELILNDKIFEITTATQGEFSIVDPGVKRYGDAVFVLTTSGGVGTGAISFSVPADNGVLSIAGDTATIINPGTVTVTAQIEGDANCEEGEATFDLTVLKIKDAPGMPDKSMSVGYETENADEILLPTDWSLASEDVGKALVLGGITKIHAVYKDTVHYENYSVEIDVSRGAAPTSTPTIEPTATAEPTAEPTAKPTPEPTATAGPTAEPTVKPTPEPTATVKPTAEPTAKPTAEPTAKPTVGPTAKPTAEPTAKPTLEPTAAPVLSEKMNQSKLNNLIKTAEVKISKISSKVSNRKVLIKWDRVDNANGYVVFAAHCKGKYKAVKTINNRNQTSWTCNKLDNESHMKFYIKAYKKVNGKKKYIKKTWDIHVALPGSKTNTNVKSIRIRSSKISMRINKKMTIKASVKKADKNKSLLGHVQKLRYQTTNRMIAAVNRKGTIKGKNAGTCYIFVYSENGICKRIKVTVKNT